jgi:two-component system, NtrC family, response regulator HydG
MTSANVLIIDDDESIRTACVQTLQESGFRARAVDNGSSAFEKISRESFDVVLLDLKMPGVSGMEILETLKRDNPVIQVIIITGYASIDLAVEAGRLGVFHFMCKPFAPEVLISTVEKAAKAKRYALEDSCVSMALNEQRPPIETVMGRSEPILNLMRLIKQVAPMNSSVLLTGETGSGKELAARTLHRLSNRSHRPFVVVDCGSLVETLFESEIFGHVKGAFTGAVDTTEGKFETAHGGTLLLDEIANINTRVQARLLRVVQEQEISKIGSSQMKKVDVRIISATNRNLQEEVEAGHFRNDLFYRLNVVQIHIPSLRERRADIPVLARYFLNLLSRDLRKPVSGISPEAMRILEDYQWPGNVRELKNAIERAIVVCQKTNIGPQDIILSQQSSTAAAQPQPTNNSLAEAERNEIIRVLIEHNGNRARSAQRLGINRKTLREKINKYGITVD